MSRTKSTSLPTHGAFWAKDLVDDLKADGFTVSQIVGNTGISIHALEAPEPKLGFDELALLFERAAVLKNDDLLGFHRGLTREFRRNGLISYVGTSSPTVATLWHNLSRYRRIFSEAIDIDTSRLDEEGITEWHYNVPRSVECGQYIEFGASGIIAGLRKLTGRRLFPDLVEFRHHRRRNVEEIERFFGCDVVFGSDENRLHMRLTDLATPLRTADDHLHNLLRGYCEEALAKKSKSSPLLTVAVEQEIAARLSSGGATQPAVAKALGMSARTLSRRLAAEGTTFFKVVEEYREAIAKSLISKTDLQITEIAFVLGYADLSSFSTAFRRWTGRTPTEIRALS